MNKENKSEDQKRMILPNRENNELFAIAEQLMGASRIQVICEDKKSRMARIPGKMKRSSRVRNGDLLIVKPWKFQDEKADILYRYTKTQSTTLQRKNLLPEELHVL